MASADDVAMDMMSVVAAAGEDAGRASIGSATLFDYAMASSYNSTAMAASSVASTDPSASIRTDRIKPVLPLDTDGDATMSDKKTGRPNHPAWDHFVRGEKRNRFHHHAYCKYCTAHGAETLPVRGVSGNMIRHLQKCVYCPPEIVAELRVLCAQKDAVNFNKRHHPNPSQAPLTTDAMVATNAAIESGEQAAKKLKKASDGVGSEELLSVGQTGTQVAAAVTTAVDSVFSALQIPMDIAALHQMTSLSQTQGRSPLPASKPQSLKPRTVAKSKQNLEQSALDEQVIRVTLSAGLPFDWIAMEEASHIAPGLLDGEDASRAAIKTTVYESRVLSSLSTHVHDTQMVRVREEATGGASGVTLAISYWLNKAERTNMLLFSVVTALGEATAWQLVDVGTEDVLLEELSSQIRAAVLALVEDGVPVIAIVADSLLAYAAAKAAMSSAEDPHPLISVFPSFEAFLVNALGVILTMSEAQVETMASVTDLVGAFSNKQMREILRRECGDQEAALVLPRKDQWFSFIDCIDSVRQFEDTIKIIGHRSMVEERSPCALTASVQETIQNPQFWENVVSLSELMSPIKETYKLMHSHGSASTAPASGGSSSRNTASVAMTFSLSNVFYQLGRMYQQYTAIMADWEENPSASRIVGHVRYLQEQVNKTWKLYDQPLMILAYTFDYNMAHPLLARNLPSLQWLSIAKYAKEYFRRWFCSAAPTNTGATRRSGLGEDSLALFLEELLTFKERKYPFDSESVGDVEYPRAFYQLISDSNPMMHVFGARLFSFATSVPQLAGVVPSKSSVARIATSPCSPSVLFPLIQLKLRPHTAPWLHSSKEILAPLQPQSLSRGTKRPVPSAANTVNESLVKQVTALESGLDPAAMSSIWNARDWRLLAKQWKIEWEHEGNVGNVLDTVAGLNSTSARLQVDVLSLDQLFKEKLPSRVQQSRDEEAVVDV